MSTKPLEPQDGALLDALLDSWHRNNTILVNLLRALPDGGLDLRTSYGSSTIAQVFNHIHYVRLVFVSEDAPEFAATLPLADWRDERDALQIMGRLNESARVVASAVAGRVRQGRGFDQHYDHPMLLLQHLIWHEGYHHGQIKLAFKATGHPLTDADIGPLTWGVWLEKAGTNPSPPAV